ncbi:MAG: DUF3108 domain-containing protein [Terriglobales bacterium]
MVLLLGLAGAAQTARPVDTIAAASHIHPPLANYRFPTGQTYVYTAEWRLWKAGTATLKLESSGAENRVTATADSSGFVALLYKVRDRFEASFDPRSFCSQRVFKHTEEGFRKRETKIRFDYRQRKSVLDETNLKNGDRKHAEQDIPGCVTDVLSGIYYLASLPLQVGNTYVFPFNDGGQTIDVHAHVEAREQIKTDAGTFSTLRVQPEASSGPLKQRGKIWIWYSDDQQHIPVQLRARAFWGTLTLKLARVESK